MTPLAPHECLSRKAMVGLPVLLVVLLGLFACLAPGSVRAQSLLVQPYLQVASPESIRVLWETSEGDESLVYWGLTDQLGEVSVGESLAGEGASRIHDVLLQGLSPDTRYHYKVVTGAVGSEIYEFQTPPLQSSEMPFRLLAMSDMQQAWAHPDKFQEVVHDGVLSYLAQEYSEDVPAELAMTLVPGDLVDNGWAYDQWADTFFGPAHPLFAQVPVYPALGNHENDTEYYFQYFHLPDNGSPGFEEHWWYLDYSNLRVVGLDSNGSYATQDQLSWLEGVLDSTCEDQGIDFVFAQLHHPHKSELWLPGESSWTGDVIALMESFSTECGKPSIHFFGHTHGYSRGQSRDHDHLWVNVATAGGAIDHWGDYPQSDYDEFTVTTADWGFVLVDVDAGDSPQFRLQRVSRGDDAVSLDNEIRDVVAVRRDNQAPDAPEALSPADGDGCAGEDDVPGPSPDSLVLVASSYQDADGDLWGASHFQVSTTCDDFADPQVDLWFQHENRYFEEDLQAADDLSDAVVGGLEGNSPYCWRVRYRDRGLRWSPWSVPAGFTTGDSALSANLLLNPGAEQGVEHWTVTEGVLESLTSGECDGREPYDGDRYFAVGGLCEGESDYGEARQTVQLKEWLADVQAGRVRAHFGGMLRDWGGDDRPEIRLDFVDAVGNTLDQSETLGLQATEWTEVSSALDVPVGAQAVDFVMMGTRNAGDDNDSYLDEVRLRLEVVTEEPSAGDDDDTTGDDDATGNEDDGDPSGGEATDGPALVSGVGDCAGCGIAPRADALGWLPTSLVVGLWVSTRRRRRLRPASVVPPSPRVPLQ